VVTLDGLDIVAPGVPTISVHLEGDMAGDGSLPQRPYQDFSNTADGPFRRRRAEKPMAEPREVEIGHAEQRGRNVDICLQQSAESALRSLGSLVVAGAS